MSSSPVRVPEEQYRTQKEEQSPQNKDEAEEEDDYDSDDPENWGPYYWSQTAEGDNKSAAAPTRKVWDNMKYYTFKGYRGAEFAGEVLVHFFGLNRSRYQWMVDLAKREAEEEEQHLREIEQRKQYRLEQKLKKERSTVESMEGQ